WYILLGALEADQLFALAVLVVSTLLNTAYLLPIVYMAFLGKPESGAKKHGAAGDHEGHGDVHHGEAPLPMLLAMGFTAAGTVLLFFFAELPLELAMQLAGRSQ